MVRIVCEIVDYLDTKHGPFNSTDEALRYAAEHLPGQATIGVDAEGNETCGFELQVVGADVVS